MAGVSVGQSHPSSEVVVYAFEEETAYPRTRKRKIADLLKIFMLTIKEVVMKL